MLLRRHRISRYLAWYYTPSALQFTDHLSPTFTVYDCMDELSAFAGADPRIIAFERELMARADIVFTGGHSLYEAKKHLHPSVYPMPSSIDYAHFAQAKQNLPDPEDQKAIPHPRLGFFGVIDERADLELIAGVAQARPDWHIVMLGPVVKIDPTALPRFPNIHYLGQKSYTELPAYLSNWEVAILPFARNESTRFISPTKTPEYLAGGKPVVSTSIRDVQRPYGELNLVHIADSVEDFVAATEIALEQETDVDWQRRVFRFLQDMSWDDTWADIKSRICAQLDPEYRVQALIGGAL